MSNSTVNGAKCLTPSNRGRKNARRKLALAEQYDTDVSSAYKSASDCLQ